MYNKNYPDKLDLLVFFEGEPIIEDSSYGECLGYQYGVGITLFFYLNLTISDATIELKNKDTTIVNISILNFKKVSINENHLTITSRDNNLSYRITLKPSILIESFTDKFD
ncbi:hypothetical protein [Providencia huashanensis]|uniref:hypothetical protein n=1 Tax=Providencia huashanensis TaxID=3037798 RepID=UPI002AFF5DDB|nr:hypothetical protein [Providencia sp. 23021821]